MLAQTTPMQLVLLVIALSIHAPSAAVADDSAQLRNSVAIRPITLLAAAATFATPSPEFYWIQVDYGRTLGSRSVIGASPRLLFVDIPTDEDRVGMFAWGADVFFKHSFRHAARGPYVRVKAGLGRMVIKETNEHTGEEHRATGIGTDLVVTVGWQWHWHRLMLWAGVGLGLHYFTPEARDLGTEGTAAFAQQFGNERNPFVPIPDADLAVGYRF